MSDSEKTRKKLVESIRKTKAGQAAAGGKAETAPVSQGGESKKAPRKKTVSKRAVAKKDPATSRRRTSAQAKPVAGPDETPRSYIRGRRVWPD